MVGIGLSAFSSGHRPEPAALSPVEVGEFGERILVVAPHPDDEVIAPGGLIWEACRAGARVRVVVLTCGDGFWKAAALRARGRTTPAAYIALGRLRREECDAALAALGVPSEDRVFLGYPDAGLRCLWESDWDPSRSRRARNGSSAVPYDFALRPGATYCGQSLAADLGDVVREFAPTSVVMPDPEDEHPDHRAAAAFTEFALGVAGYPGARFTYLAHFGHYPLLWTYAPAAFIRPPAELGATRTVWRSLNLDPRAQAGKLAAVLCYRSQVRLPHMNAYLRSFVRRNELFGTYAPARPVRVADDACPPATTADDIVVAGPARRSRREVLRRGRFPSAIRMAMGPSVLWTGVTVLGATDRPADVALRLRLLDGGSQSRIDAETRRDATVAVVDAAGCAVPGDVPVHRDGDTVWFGLPAALAADRAGLLVSAEVLLPGGITVPTAWRPVALS